jgi:hypothetical protein
LELIAKKVIVCFNTHLVGLFNRIKDIKDKKTNLLSKRHFLKELTLISGEVKMGKSNLLNYAEMQ